ncbi:MAG: hypothetical protein MI757_07590 [Pirellulales bacterium]|nr:hypothetical protein [Pirellulales bacterium]
MTTQPCVGPPPATVDVEDLTWQLLDEQIEEPTLRTLERELIKSEDSRKTYVDCVQLHVDLMAYFGDKSGKPLVKMPFDQ